MKLTALITEYNPFHNGHSYHLNESRKITDADGIIVIMSGNFVQRGTPAIFDKWTRAQMALEMGADLIIELPTAYAVSSAEHFAFGAIGILDGLCGINNVVFGSESADIDSLKKIGTFLHENKLINNPNWTNSNSTNNLINNYSHNQHATYEKNINICLKNGMSYPRANEIALSKTLKSNMPNINSPNDILGIEYIKSLLRLNSNIRAHAIKRNSCDYHSIDLTSNISSATSIRNHILSKNSTPYLDLLSQVKHAIPYQIYHIYKNATPVKEEALFSHILYKLWSENSYSLCCTEGMSEGLENRIIKKSQNSKNYNNLIDNIKTKRYTRTRIQRTLLAMLLNITSDFTKSIYSSPNYLYARILGSNKNGRNILKSLKKVSSIPIVTNVNKFQATSELMNQLIELDYRASDIYSLLNTEFCKGIDQRHPPILKN